MNEDYEDMQNTVRWHWFPADHISILAHHNESLPAALYLIEQMCHKTCTEAKNYMTSQAFNWDNKEDVHVSSECIGGVGAWGWELNEPWEQIIE